MASVAVIDYGMGNLHSIAKALQTSEPGVHVRVSNERSRILSADRVVFPGVGAIRDCMQSLTERELIPVVTEAASTKPFLGVCLGMQALLVDSEENDLTPCLGLMEGRVVRFRNGLKDAQGRQLKIPHMGWNRVHQSAAHPLWDGIPQGTWFYFVHSYYAQPLNPDLIAATSDYPEPFAAALAQDNIFAVQFHPEKSQAAGLRLLSNFLRWEPGRC